nr:hypothetical protein [uncultured Allomuricauda sp.]
MRLFGKCPSCKKENSFKSDAQTRIDYEMKNGKWKSFVCTECGEDFRLMINNIYSKKSNLASIVAGLVFLIGTPIVIYLFKDILLQIRGPYSILIISSLFIVPSIIYSIVLNEDQKRVSTFNQLKVRE